MNTENSIFGCFVSSSGGNWDDDQKAKDVATAQGALFRTYIWGEQGICDNLKQLKNSDYGDDLLLVLFQFYVNPIPFEGSNLKEIENYRKKEKSIGIPIIIDESNFFSQSESDRRLFLKTAILEKLLLLEATVKKRKLDTDMIKLKHDTKNILA